MRVVFVVDDLFAVRNKEVAERAKSDIKGGLSSRSCRDGRMDGGVLFDKDVQEEGRRGCE